jgi:hypothetical protein
LSITIKETISILQRYTKDTTGKDITEAEIRRMPYHRAVFGEWKARAYYKIRNYYQRLEDVPEGVDRVHIVTDNDSMAYERKNGEWVPDYTTRLTKEEVAACYDAEWADTSYRIRLK